jgi:hypothetical protein
VAQARKAKPDARRAEAVVGADRRAGAREDCAGLSPSDDVIKPQHAIERLYELTKDRETYITTEVGQHQMWAAQFFGFEAEPLDDLRRPRHDGLRPAGGDRRAGRASGRAGASTLPATRRS